MTQEEVLAEFRNSGALLEGHFKLSSGKHSGHYLQCARVLMNPARAARLAEAVVAGIPGEVLEKVDVVVSPAMGGIIIGHEVGRVLGKDALFLERPEGTFHLRRGFALDGGAKVLMVEDVVTTGLSSREAIAAVAREGGEVIAECAIIDRSCGSVDLGVPFYPLLAIDFPTYDPDSIPEDLARVAVTKPGSRKE
ncbi:orotate phosphoribosyltransferase [Erythrobacter dokdonensis]|jgi:orotate phosphoribosyltransferase|uniref:Orotate phosphoribosyltransferase n=1 Tax=Erythrobacter dokdonensis DSW-74 TaxID=1300349 RepID=A0A1A7BG95_9SPHN|nr:orotate phosphoribosyltransferase [Erythrobacter dokdonensis]MEE4317149.1 orotate phosphoribosyltransferase [Erythrobacter sp.]OBV11509.1 Orotate phosphoribosyltransferase [Erythrobacter dokdonensis DSW-74]